MGDLLRILERRGVPGLELELRETSDGKLQFNGYASVWDSRYDMGWYEERVVRGAFAKSISEAARPGYESTRDIGFLSQHDPATVMARTSNGSLRLEEDDHGLRVEAELDPADADVTRLAGKLRARNVYQMSHARVTLKEEWDEESEPALRTIKEAQLFEVSPVTFPASPSTQADIRAALQSLDLDAKALGVDLRSLIPSGSTAASTTSATSANGSASGGTVHVDVVPRLITPDLTETLDALLSHAKGRSVGADEAEEVRRAVETLRGAFAAEPSEPDPIHSSRSLRIAHATTRIRRYREAT